MESLDNIDQVMENEANDSQENGNKSDGTLLLKSIIDYNNNLPDYPRKLDSLFEIFVGINESNFQEFAEVRDEKNPVKVKIIRLINADPSSGRIIFEEEKSKQKNEGKAQNKPLIPQDKLLTKDDYLINLRNRPCGYSIADYFDETGHSSYLSASNQFVIFRPEDTANYDVGYLHKVILNSLVKFVFAEQDMFENMRSDAWIRKLQKTDLDILSKKDKELHATMLEFFFRKEGVKYVKKSDVDLPLEEARRLFKQYEMVNGKETFSFNSLKVLDLRQWEVMVHKDKTDREIIMDKINAYEANLKIAQMELNNYYKELASLLRLQLGIKSTNI